MRAMLALMAGAATLTACHEQAKQSPEAASKEAAQQVAEQAKVETPAPKAGETPAAAGEVAFKEVFPHVWVDGKARAVRFDGVVPIDAHDADAPLVFLEVVVCSPDTKEHEALVMTQAKASHVHAALLLIGLQPGSPGRWTFEEGELKPIPPRGDEVEVLLSFRGSDGTEKNLSPEEMVVTAKDGKQFGSGKGGKWVFAGSQIVKRGGRDWYDADGAGTLVGLTTFGSETIAWSEMISPEASVQEPEWIARKEATPAVGTRIVVTIRPAK